MFSSLITLYQFVVSESYSSLSMTAFMGNSGALSSYLAMLFPWLLVFYSNSKKKLKYTYVLTIFLTIFIIILTQGRASWVAVFFSTLFIVSIKNSFLPRRLAVFRKSKKTKIVSLLAFSLFLIIFGLVVFNLKKDSANGRLFIWKRTIEIIKEEPLIGIGYGKFSSLYPICQANYLKENKTDTARFLANDINHPFNEYLHITTELGLVGLLFFLGIFISIFLYKPKLNKINLACSGSIISFLILSLFTYPFKIFSIQFLLFLFLVIFSSNTNKKVFSLKKKHIMILFVPIVLLVFWIVDSEITRSSNERELKKILDKENKIVDEKRIYTLNQLYKNNNRDWSFLMSFGIQLFENKNYNQAINVFSEASKYFITSDLQFYLGFSFEELGSFEEARKCFEISSNIVPHKFLPKYHLVLLLDKMNLKEDAYKLAKEIIVTPAKVNSKTVINIKYQMREYVLENNQKIN